jgi:hypothetical protein
MNEQQHHEHNTHKLIRNFVLEMIVYSALLLVYFLTILRILGNWLFDLFNNNLLVYAIVGLMIMLIQGVVLEWLTSLLIRLLGLERME